MSLTSIEKNLIVLLKEVSGLHSFNKFKTEVARRGPKMKFKISKEMFSLNTGVVAIKMAFFVFNLGNARWSIPTRTHFQCFLLYKRFWIDISLLDSSGEKHRTEL